MKMEDYNKYYIQNSNHYLIPKDVFMELFNEMINWKEESQKQKEVIDKAINDLNIILEIVREQPSGSDCWIIDRLEANKSILKEVE